MNRRLGVLLLIAGLTLSGCGDDGMNDLRDFVKNAHADRQPKIEPMPEIKPQEGFTYAASDLMDPFSSANLKPVSTAQGNGGPRPDFNRRKEPLEDYPLDGLRMVGILSRDKQSWAVIQAPDGTVHRIQTGNHLGQNFGKVIKVTEEKVIVVELIQGAVGDWVEREASLALNSE